MTTAICWTHPLEHSALVAVHPEDMPSLIEEADARDIDLFPTLTEAQRVLRDRLATEAVELRERFDAVVSRIAMIDLKMAPHPPPDPDVTDVDTGDAPPPPPVMPDPDDSGAWERFMAGRPPVVMRWHA